MTDAGNPIRHVLVVGAQCEGGDNLEGLEDAARDLHAVLVDPDLGGCVNREGSLLLGTNLGADAVRKAVERAAEAARDDGSPLVLALLGHGEGGEGAPLYFVTSGRRNAQPLANLDVSSLLEAALNHSGLTGLIAIVDTCFSGAAVPNASATTAGLQGGMTRGSLLFAATAKQPAFGMQLSRQLALLIREGLPDAGHFLEVDSALLQELRDRIAGQNVGRNNYDGDPYPGDSLWLARNRRACLNHSLGSVSSEVVRAAVRRIDPSLRLSTEAEIDAWLRENPPTAGVGPWAAVQRLHEVKDELTAARRTLAVGNKVFGPDLTEESLRLAGMLAGLPLHLVRQERAPTLRNLVEHAAHRGRDVHGSHRALAHLVAAMTHVARPGARLAEEVTALALDLDFSFTVNSRLGELDEGTTRLVLVLADDGGESVVRVDAWLHFGRAVLGNKRFSCGPGAEGLKTALAKAVAWAAPWANVAREPLEHIDVAAPTLALLDFPPEEQFVGTRRLGVNYTVTTRWSGLLTPPPDTTLEDMLQVGERLLASLKDGTGCTGPKWLHEEQLGTIERLREHLGNHRVGRQVWAVASLPKTDWALMAQELLEHTPALVWPRQRHVTDDQVIKASVEKHWRALPRQIARAYQDHPTGVVQSLNDDLGHLAAVRAVWHDKDWHAFCARRARAVVQAPHEMTPKERT
ncbi:vWA-MoxR associated conflict system protein [Streptomyces phaeochromogenes]